MSLFRFGAAAALVAVQGAYAQTASSYAGEDAPISYTTVTYDVCSTASMETMITVTNGVTVTYCPDCTEGGPVPTVAPSSIGHVTTYTTTYLSLCPTGTVPVTYTITESCPEATPTWTPGPSHVPQGYTVKVKDCTVCHSDLSKPSTIPVTITEPCDCDANEGTIVPPKPTAAEATPTGAAPSGRPIQQISDGQIQNPGGDAPAATCPGGDNCPADGGSNPPAATGGDGPSASGPAGTAPPADTAPPAGTAPAGNNGTDGVPPPTYEGGASTTVGLTISLVVAGVIGAMAVLL